MDKEGGPTLKEFRKGCNIWNAVYDTGDSSAEIKDSTMHGLAQIWCMTLKVLRRLLKMPQRKLYIL
jgi:hypothetical protein